MLVSSQELSALNSQNHTKMFWLGQNTGKHKGRSQGMYKSSSSHFIRLQPKARLFLTSTCRLSEGKGANLGFGYSCVTQLCSEPFPASYTTLSKLPLLCHRIFLKLLHWEGEQHKPPWQSETQGKHQASRM